MRRRRNRSDRQFHARTGPAPGPFLPAQVGDPGQQRSHPHLRHSWCGCSSPTWRMPVRDGDHYSARATFGVAVRQRALRRPRVGEGRGRPPGRRLAAGCRPRASQCTVSDPASGQESAPASSVAPAVALRACNTALARQACAADCGPRASPSIRSGSFTSAPAASSARASAAQSRAPADSNAAEVRGERRRRCDRRPTRRPRQAGSRPRSRARYPWGCSGSTRCRLRTCSGGPAPCGIEYRPLPDRAGDVG